MAKLDVNKLVYAPQFSFMGSETFLDKTTGKVYRWDFVKKKWYLAFYPAKQKKKR